MREQFMPEQMGKIQEEAWDIKEEVDDIYPIRQKYETMQKTADLVIKKRELSEDFKREWDLAMKSLPEGKKPMMPINEKAIANLYAAGHIFNKDFTMEHIVKCLVDGEEVTDKIEYPKAGSRYFKLEAPKIDSKDRGKYIGMAGRFVIPNENLTPLAEHVANWNQACEYKFRHGKKCAIIKKQDIPQWLVEDFESEFYVLIEKNEYFDSKTQSMQLQAADGPTSKDPEGDWMISTVHFGEPSRRKPRPPKEPRWNEITKDTNLALGEIIKYQKAVADYQKAYDSWTDEQERVVFVDLEEKGVGQKGIKQESRINDPNIAELVHDNEDLRKMLNNAIGEINKLKGEIKGIKTKADKNSHK